MMLIEHVEMRVVVTCYEQRGNNEEDEEGSKL
jgi:hypothetical protein